MKEALKLALEALTYSGLKPEGTCDVDKAAITAIKEALAQPEQEPVAYCYVQKGTSVDILTFDDAPDDAVDGTIFPLYTTPPKRPWVGLTDEEIWSAVSRIGTSNSDVNPYQTIADARTIEAKLKELNT